jgi:hypothetical protein
VVGAWGLKPPSFYEKIINDLGWKAGLGHLVIIFKSFQNNLILTLDNTRYSRAVQPMAVEAFIAL